MKKVTSTKKKEVKPLFTVDFTNVHDLEEAKLRIIEAKGNANIPLSDEEKDLIRIKIAEDVLSFLYENTEAVIPFKVYAYRIVHVLPKKKPNIFVRFWNWLKYAFTW